MRMLLSFVLILALTGCAASRAQSPEKTGTLPTGARKAGFGGLGVFAR